MLLLDCLQPGDGRVNAHSALLRPVDICVNGPSARHFAHQAVGFGKAQAVSPKAAAYLRGKGLVEENAGFGKRLLADIQRMAIAIVYVAEIPSGPRRNTSAEVYQAGHIVKCQQGVTGFETTLR